MKNNYDVDCSDETLVLDLKISVSKIHARTQNSSTDMCDSSRSRGVMLDNALVSALVIRSNNHNPDSTSDYNRHTEIPMNSSTSTCDLLVICRPNSNDSISSPTVTVTVGAIYCARLRLSPGGQGPASTQSENESDFKSKIEKVQKVRLYIAPPSPNVHKSSLESASEGEGEGEGEGDEETFGTSDMLDQTEDEYEDEYDDNTDIDIENDDRVAAVVGVYTQIGSSGDPFGVNLALAPCLFRIDFKDLIFTEISSEAILQSSQNLSDSSRNSDNKIKTTKQMRSDVDHGGINVSSLLNLKGNTIGENEGQVHIRQRALGLELPDDNSKIILSACAARGVVLVGSSSSSSSSTGSSSGSSSVGKVIVVDMELDEDEDEDDEDEEEEREEREEREENMEDGDVVNESNSTLGDREDLNSSNRDRDDSNIAIMTH